MREDAGDLLIVGRIRKAHGIRGEVVVEVMTEAPDAVFAPGARLFPGTPAGDRDPKLPAVHVEYARPFGDQLLVALEEVPDRAAAERWRDRFFLVPRDEIPDPGPGSVFVHELAGLQVVDGEAGPVGRVLGTFEVAGRLLLEVDRPEGKGTLLLPYEPHFVESVDIEAGKLRMRLPEGLLE